ncbi:MAG: signal peptidase I [Acidimicrobiales bacterium]
MDDDETNEPPTGASEPTATAGPARRRRRRAHHSVAHSRRRALIELAIGLAIAVLIALGIRTYVFQAYFVPSSSMEPTLQVGDRILVDKFDFSYHSVRAGDIVVFHTPSAASRDCATDDGDLVKRVVATGGQTIWSQQNVIKIRDANGKTHDLNESYFPDDGKHTPIGEPIVKYTVPKNDFYVMGDNRSISCDSRIWGPVPGTDIVGRVVAVVWRSWHPDLIIF